MSSYQTGTTNHDANDSNAGSDGSTDRPLGAEPEYATLVVHVTVGW